MFTYLNSIRRNQNMWKISWVSTKLVRYLDCVFNPMGTVNYMYELNFCHFYPSTTGENIWEHYGTDVDIFSWYICRFSLFFFPCALVLKARFARFKTAMACNVFLDKKQVLEGVISVEKPHSGLNCLSTAFKFYYVYTFL